MKYGCSSLDTFAASYFSLQWIILAPLGRVHLPAESHRHLETLDCYTSSNQSASASIFLPTHLSSHQPKEITKNVFLIELSYNISMVH